jgi:hypothetical protein
VEENVGKSDGGGGQAPGDRQLPGRVAHDGLVGVVGLELGGADHIADAGEAADVFICRPCDVMAYKAGGCGSLAVGPTVVEALAVEGGCTTGRKLFSYSGSIEDESDRAAVIKSIRAGGIGCDVKGNEGNGLNVAFTLDIPDELGNIFTLRIWQHVTGGRASQT